MSQSYLFEQDQSGIARLTLNRPEVHNAFNDEMITELIAKFQEIAADQKGPCVDHRCQRTQFLCWCRSQLDEANERLFCGGKLQG